MNFRYFISISPLKKVGSFTWTNFNSFHRRFVLCSKIAWNWPCDSGEDFKKNSQCIFAVVSLGKGRNPYLNKLESSLPKFGWNWPSGSGEQLFFKISSTKLSSVFRYYLPLEKCLVLHVNIFESPLPKDDLIEVWLKLASCSGKKEENTIKCPHLHIISLLTTKFQTVSVVYLQFCQLSEFKRA